MEAWPIVWLFVVLKVPLIAALWIVWWAIRSEPAEGQEARSDGGGGRGPDHPRPRRPRPPRRGPHAAPSSRPPGRVRVTLRRRSPSPHLAHRR